MSYKVKKNKMAAKLAAILFSRILNQAYILNRLSDFVQILYTFTMWDAECQKMAYEVKKTR